MSKPKRMPISGSGVATQYTALGFLHEMPPPPLNTVVKAD